MRFVGEMEAAFTRLQNQATIGRIRIVFIFLVAFGLLGIVGKPPNADRAVATVDYIFTAIFALLLGMAYTRRFQGFAATTLATAAVLSQVAVGLTAKSTLPPAGIIFNLLYAIIVIATLQVRFRTALTFSVATLAARAFTFSYRSMWDDEAVLLFTMLTAELIFLCLASYLNETRDRKSFLLEQALKAERARTHELVKNVLPPTIAEQLTRDTKTIAQHYDSATIMFADIVGFTAFAANHTPNEVVGLLNDLFSRFDRLIKATSVVKIKTVGDSYMVAGGIPDHDPNHLANVADAALELRGAANAAGVAMRIGIHTGPLIAGVLGTERLMYDVWGSTVNLASRLEASADAGQIVVSSEVREGLLQTHDFEHLGTRELKGLGPVDAYLLTRRKVAPMTLN